MKNTKGREIHVIKKSDLLAPEPPAAPPISERSIMAAVDGWIGERNDNRDADLISSSLSITKWRTLPDTSI